VISGLDTWILAGALLVQMALIAGLLVEGRRRRRASEALDERLRFETLLADMSAAFAGTGAPADGTIREWLERLAVFLDVDRAALIPVAPADRAAYGVISYARPGVEASPDIISEDAFPWYIQQVRRGVTLNYARILDELPAEATREREYVRRVGVKSHLSVPINTGRSAICELTISTMRAHRTWPDDLVARLRVVGDIFAQALMRAGIERALRDSEERYRSVVEHQTDLICRYLPDTTLTFVNDAYCCYWRKTREELIGTKFVELIPEGSRAVTLQHVASVVERPREEANEHQVLLPDGSIGWQQWIDRVIVGADGRVVELQGIGRDVTERRRAEDALRDSEERFRAIFNEAGTGISLMDLTGELPGECNRALQTMLRCGPHDLARFETFDELTHASERERDALLHRELREGKRDMLRQEKHFVLHDGTDAWANVIFTVLRDAQSRPRYIIGMHEDITERKRAEAALRDSQRRYALATLAGSVGVWDWNVETDELYVDPLLETLLGFCDDKIANLREVWTRLVHPDDLAGLLSQLQDHIKGRTPTFEVELRMLHKDGSVRWFLARAAVIRHADGRPRRVIGTNTDITGRRQAEEALRKARIELAHAARLSALGELSASIAHELGQPLTAILSNAHAGLNLLAQNPPPLGELREILADIAHDDERAGEIIRRMNALLRKRELETQMIDMNELVRDTARLVASDAAARRVQIATELAGGLPAVRADKIHLQQVVLNLLLNGMEALAAVPPPSRRLLVRTAACGDQLQVAVIDTGRGIPADLLQDIFEPFCTTKGDGMGIGLSIARTIVEAHGGHITAENGPTGGATVRFFLPTASLRASPPAESSAARPAQAGMR
jgi:PAS domain S-box-containing protein